MDGAHHDFIDKMYKRFGLTEHPGYCVIDVLPLFSTGGFCTPNKIFISDTINRLRSGPISYTVYHESSHFLHSCACKEIWDELRPPKKFDRKRALNELVADLGAAVFLRNYSNEHELNAFVKYQNTDRIMLTALELLPHQDILMKIANATVKEADEILISLTRKSLKSLTR